MSKVSGKGSRVNREQQLEELQKEIADWYYSAKAMIDHLYLQTYSMTHELAKANSPLAVWLDHDEMAALSSMLDQASCRIADIPPPLPHPIADPMGVVLTMRAGKRGGRS